MSLPSPNSIRPNNPAGSTPEGLLRKRENAKLFEYQRSKRETTTENAAVGLCILRINGVFRDLAMTK